VFEPCLNWTQCNISPSFFYKQSKKFVESVPQVVQRDVSKEEAERLKSVLEAAGGVVELE